MAVKREIILYATIRVQNRFVKLVQLDNQCRMYEDVETRGDSFKLETGMSPISADYIDWYCIKQYGINLN